MGTVNKFKVSDIVQLKSGGVLMTVEEIPIDGKTKLPSEDSVICIWFDKNKLCRSTFKNITLKYGNKPLGIKVNG